MCGIAGIVSLDKRLVEQHQLKTMTDVIAHRGPDGEGHWVSQDGVAGLGHRRLSIIDLSVGAAQPMHYADGRYSLTFNGEIYNYIELRSDLEKKGYQFVTASDTEVLLALYCEFGQACLKFLDGMFAFAIWDEQEKKLFAARDRFGEKPFHYCMHEGRFYFASEMKALFAVGCPKNVSLKRVHYYLSYNLYQDPKDSSSTFYEGVFQLPPAHFLTLSSEKGPDIQRYWAFNTEQESTLSLKEAAEKFDHLLRQSITRRLRSDVPVGSSLSGGLDSSTIVMLINRMKQGDQVQKTFSARFRDFSKDEGNFIKELQNSISNVQGFETWPDSTLLNELDTIWYHQEEPFGSASIIAQWAVMKLAREHNVTVLLDGQGADEILCGYRPFFVPYLNNLYANNNPAFESEKKALLENQNYNFQLGRNTALMLRHPGIFKAASQVKHVFSPRKKQEPRAHHEMFSDEFLSGVPNDNPVAEENNDNVKLAQVRLFEKSGFIPLLRYADRNSMAHSRELRLPFLSHELVEFCLSLPDQMKIHDGWTKYLMRFQYDQLLPEKICWRKDKVGFEAPQSQWMQTKSGKEMVDHAEETVQKSGMIRSGKKLQPWQSLMISRLINTR